jgi:hypothetical protein
MRIHFLILCGLLSFNVFSQASNKVELPNINPPSPESFMFTEYGKNGINEYSGKLNVNVPIYEYKAGNLSMPITLNYSGAGVKVEDISTWTGTNWNLNVGGVISRQIKDGSDEFTSRVIINENDVKANAKDLCAPNSQYYWDLARNESFYDTEADIFNFSFMGYSGSFYLDANFNPVYLENENEIKIQIVGSFTSSKENFVQNKAFLITTPDGIKYYFGGSQTETTRVLSAAHSIDADGITSYFLYRIEHPVNGTMILEYDNLAPKKQVLSKSYDMSTSICDAAEVGRLLYVTNFDERKFVARIMDPKRLKKIKSPDSNIEISFLRTDYNANLNFNSVLNSIEIANNQSPNVLLKKINFSYEAKVNPQGPSNDFLNASRFFLTKVEINKNLKSKTNQYEKYSFEYDDPFGLPDRMSNSRDALGYFNNKLNTSLVPIWKDNAYYFFNQPESFANLNPSFAYAKKGSLTKITYPTTGYSKFEYEPIPAKKKKITPYSFSINTYDWNELGYPFVMTIPGDNLFSGEIVHTDFPSVYEDQTISFKIDLNIMEHSGGSAALTGKGVEFIIRDLGTFEETVFTRVFPLTAIPDFTYNLKKGHNYSFILRFKGVIGSASLTSSLVFEVFEGYNVVEGLGVRLKRDTNYNFDNTQTDQKRYYYGTINGGYNDVAKFNFLDYNPKRTYIKGPIGTMGNGFSGPGLDAIFSSEIVGEGNTIFENPEKFPVVSISFGGDSFENGGIEKHFLNITDAPSYAIRIPVINDGCWHGPDGLVVCGLPTEFSNNMAAIRSSYKTFEKSNMGYYNGKLLCERTYSNNNGLLKIKEQVYKYNLFEDNSKRMTNFVGRVIFNDMGFANHCPDINGPAYNSLSSCYFAYYNTKALSFKLMNSISTDYISPVPLSNYVNFYDDNYLWLFYGDVAEGIGEQNPIDQEAVEASFKKIIAKQDNEYGVLRGLPTKITSVTSDESSKSIVNTYVNQVNSFTDLTSSQRSAYEKMMEQNNVATPVQVQEYQNNAIPISSQRKTFKLDNASHVLPEIIKSSKGGQGLEDRILFDEFDIKGNPTLFSYKDGSKTKYLYNVNNQVIAKLENFTGTLDPNIKVISGTACDFIKSYPNSFVTVYNYDSLTNLMVSTISPNCMMTYYEYDYFNRLKYIKDQDLNVVKMYCYNYKGQITDCLDLKSTLAVYKSVAKSGTFTRDNCELGGAPSSVTYTVPAEQYISGESQAEADNQAQEDINAYGQNYANANAVCTFSSAARSSSFTRNNCTAGGVGSTVGYNQLVGAVTSIISQTDADAIGLAKFNTDGQNYANANAVCTFSSAARSGSFTRNNCAAGGVGSTVGFSQVSGAVTSTVSQADADAKGLSRFNTDGQNYANANAVCTFNSIARSGSFTRNNCAAGGIGSSVSFSQVSGMITSTVSQADADAKGLNRFKTDGQNYANANANCTFSSATRSGSFTRNNCAVGGVGSSVGFSQVSGVVTSTVSQTDADANGLSKFNIDGQNYANANGICTFRSVALSSSFTRNNCATGGVASSVGFSQVASAVTSTVSQADADAIGLSKFNTDGQNYANSNASCTFSSIARSGSVTRNNCAKGYYAPSSVSFIQVFGTETSNASQADADAKGLNKFNTDGQNYANANGSCVPISFTYDYIFNEDTQDIDINVYSSSPNHNGATFNLRIRFYGSTGGLKNLDRSIVLPAGQTSAHAGYRTTAFSIYDVQLISLVKN